jgi:hypothetical protein
MYFQAVDLSFLFWPLIAGVYLVVCASLIGLQLHYPILPPYKRTPIC